MKIYVLPRLECEALEPRADTAIVSITNPRQKPAELPGWPYVLSLGFHDVDHPVPGWLAMVPQQARAIVQFANQVPPHVKFIIVHCEYANARSPAVAFFLAQWLQCDMHWDRDGVPNSWVWKQLTMAARRYAWCRPAKWKMLWRLSRVKPTLALPQR